MAQQPEALRFPCRDTALAGRYFRGDGPASCCIVMAHGFGLPAAAGLDRYAALFAAAGYHVLVFDYRNFGASDGEPRQLLDIGMQLDDWRAAIAHARGLPDVDPERIVLWGTSFSGGHVVVIAARDSRIAAVISQIPFMDGLAMLPVLGARNLLRLSLPIMRDIGRQLSGRTPHYLPIAGAPGDVAALPVAGARAGYRQLLEAGAIGRDDIAARILLRLPLYRPVRFASRVRCPLLIQVAESDSITPPRAAERAAHLAPRGLLQRFPGGHFDVYSGDAFGETTREQLAFLERVAPSHGPA